MLVPAGGVDKDGVWHPVKNKEYLVCERSLSTIFRAKFMAAAKKALPCETFPQELWKTDWVVKIKPPVRNPKKVLDYLGRYVHRIAISNSHILSLIDGMVTFRYQESDSSSANKKRLLQVRCELREKAKIQEEPPKEPPATAASNLCPCCKKGRLVVVETLPRKARSPPWQGMWKTEEQG